MAANPYRPGVGLQPPYLAGRKPEQERFALVLRSAPGIPANVRITGLRGVGKTVLLQRLKDIAEEADWATISFELQGRHNHEAALRDLFDRSLANMDARLSRTSRVKAKLGEIAEAARGALRVSYEGFEWSLAGDVGQEVVELGDRILASTMVAVEAGKLGLALLLDEAQLLNDGKKATDDHPLSMLLSAVASLQKQQIPVALVLCGLPTLTVNLLGARTYSERMFQGFEVSSLATDEARKAFVEPLRETGVSASEQLVDRVLDAVDGYPYFVQLWGAELWDAATDARLNQLSVGLLDAIEESIYRRLDLDFYEPRVEALRPAERDLLIDTAACSYPPIFVAELNSATHKSPDNVNVLLGRLVKANVIFRPRKGEYLYTAPGFRDYLLRRVRSSPPSVVDGSPKLFAAKLTKRLSTTEKLRLLVAALGPGHAGFAMGLHGDVPSSWLDGGVSPLSEDEVGRLDAVFRIYRLVSNAMGPEAASDWYLSGASGLGGDSPAEAMRKGRDADVQNAAIEHLAD